MPDLSVIIPARNEIYLTKMITDLLVKSQGETEIIVILDGYWGETPIDNPKVTYLHLGQAKGMRNAINLGISIAKGKYLMKSDAHCLFAPGYDVALTKDCAENWLVIPRRYSLHAAEWRPDKRMTVKDYHYLSFPRPSSYGCGTFPQEWRERTYRRLSGPEIDDTMTFQGSCWVANKKYFMKQVGFLDDRMETYSTFSGEPLEVGLKYWLGGGEVKVNKKTWYAHLFKNENYYRGRSKDRKYKKDLKSVAGHTWAAKHWLNNEEPNMVHPFSWLAEKFWPVPTWPEDRELWKI